MSLVCSLKKKQRLKEPMQQTQPAPNSSAVSVIQNCISRVEPPPATTTHVPERSKIMSSASKSVNVIENPTNYSTKPSPNEPKTHPGSVVSKYKDKNQDVANNVSLKSDIDWNVQSKSIMAQFGFDLPSIKNDLSITPVTSDYPKTSPVKTEIRKDVISITPFPDNAPVLSDAHFIPSSSRFDDNKSTLKQLIENAEIQSSLQSKNTAADLFSAEKRREKEKKQERYKAPETGKKPEEAVLASAKLEMNSVIQPQLSKEEQEQRQIEETVAATNVLSQLINDCPLPSLDEQAEQEKDVQDVHMVMRSLKELQKLQERSSPNRSPMTTNSAMSFGYPDEFRWSQKKEDKLKMNKRDSPW